MQEQVGRDQNDVTLAGGQSRRAVRLRRIAFFGALGAGWAALWLWLGSVLAAGGVSALDLAALALAAPVAAWLVFGALNAVIALTLLLLGRRLERRIVSPYVQNVENAEPPRTALAMTLRNEDAGRALRRLAVMRESLDATGFGARFDIAVLSDSDHPDAIADEEAAFAALETRLAGAGRALYRRRATNKGFKAGNLRAFVNSAAADQELMLVLDADSVMDGDAALRLARIMAARPRIAVLQSLILSTPGRSAFTRALRFWAQTAVRTHYLGHAWWQADCGAYGGHNAMVRIAPFRTHARLPALPGRPPLGGAVLGHDHAEAMLMRRAGWEVRLWPEPIGSWEDHPLTAPDFAAREQRWRRGTLQYLLLAPSRRFTPMGRFQLLHMTALSLAPAFAAALAALLALEANAPDAALIDASQASALWLTGIGLGVAPQLVGFLDTIRQTPLGRGFGGAARFLASAALTLIFAMLLAPMLAVKALAGAVDLLRIRLLGQAGAAWTSPPREGGGLAWTDAARALWAPTAYGVALASILVAADPVLLLWAAPALLGLVLSIPFAVLTASPRLGAALRRAGLWLIPEEAEPPAIIAALEADSKGAAARVR